LRAAHSVADVRAAEAALMQRLPTGTLMSRAATGLSATCAGVLDRIYGAEVVALVGSGDNGGDALFAAAQLARRGASVRVVTTADPHAAGLAAATASGARLVSGPAAFAALGGADLVLDGIVGIGAKGPLRDEASALVGAIGPAAIVVAVDLPSGVVPDTGEVTGSAVQADVTVTFGTYKPCHLIDPAAGLCGVVRLVDIGLRDLPEPSVLAWQAEDVAGCLPVPDRGADKYSRGVLAVLAGSARYPGAAILSTGAALNSGAGYVRVSAGKGVSGPVRLAHPEAVVVGEDPADAGHVQAWAIGPGLGTDSAALERVRVALAGDVPTVLDADALTILAGQPELLNGRSADTVLTPHYRELGRLLDVDADDVADRRLWHAQDAADRYGATVLLKGSTSLVAIPGGSQVIANPTGTPALATAGSGDVLTGLVGALLAGGVSGVHAAAAGAWIHGLAGRMIGGSHSTSAGALVDAIPDAFAAVLDASS
jgi:hydroxyethylthiazole kinase-like uncharacterized protein yjeF